MSVSKKPDSTAPEINQELLDSDMAPEMLEIQKVLANVDADEQKETPAELETTEDLPAVVTTNVGQESPVDSLETDEAVAEIVAAEGDEILEIEDAVRDAESETEKPKGIKQKLAALWAKPVVRWGTVTVVVIGLLSVVIVPTERYFVLNIAGVRSSSSVTVYDASTQQPLKNTTVRIGSAQGLTDAEGKVRLQKVKLGKQKFVIEKRAFATATKTIVVGWGSNPLGNIDLTPTGTQYDFVATDFVSGKPLGKVEFSSGEASALADDTGHAKLTVDKPGDQDLQVDVKLDGFRADTLTIKTDSKDVQQVKLAPARKQLFISKRAGKYDLYSIYADGQQEKLVLAGSGSERVADLVLVPHPSDAPVAYVSTRGNQTNSDGYLLSNLILVDSDSSETANVIASESINIIGWSGTRLIYVAVTAGQSARSPDRYRVMSYDYKTGDNKQLANANYFNDVTLFGGQVYYAPNGGLESSPAKLYRINVDGTNDQAVFDQEVWAIIRVGYEELALSVQQQWFSYVRGSSQATKRNAAPADQQSRIYVDSPDGKHSAWVDVRDGKGVLLAYDLGTKTDKILAEQPGLTYPVRWLNSTTLVYRVGTTKETAEYVVSLDGGQTTKLTDVTATKGLGSTPKY